MKSWMSLVVAACAFFPNWVLANPPTIAGSWAYNPALSAELEPKINNGSIFSGTRASIGVIAIPIPFPSTVSEPEDDNDPPKDPDALYCQTLSIRDTSGKVVVTYDNLGQREFVPGSFRGRHATWTGEKLTERYETNHRMVKHQFALNRDGRLEITITLNPNTGLTRVYKRIFDRVSDDTAEPSSES